MRRSTNSAPKGVLLSLKVMRGATTGEASWPE